MKVRVMMWGVTCDGCNKAYESHDGAAFFHLAETLNNYLKCDPRGWIQHEEKHYCPQCHLVDTNDNTVIKKH